MLTAESLGILARILEILAVFVIAFIYIRKGKVNEASDLLEGVFLNAISFSRSQNTGDTKQMKRLASEFVKQKLKDPKVDGALKELDLHISDEVVDRGLEVALHAGKLQLTDVLKKLLKAGVQP